MQITINIIIIFPAAIRLTLVVACLALLTISTI